MVGSSALSLQQPNPINIQVVFQGGGARLCHLMAVCEVLRTLEKEKRILIRRVGGSSAGAIAAAMLASEDEINTFANRIRKIAPKTLENLQVGRARGYFNLIFGKKYFPKLNLVKVFEELFYPNDKKILKISDLRLPTQIYYTDLLGLSARTCEDDELVVSALSKSCRIPLAFGGFRSEDHHVDGGLSENLPVDKMRSEESTFGPVIGISFSSTEVKTDHKNLPSYLIHLFSAAIQAGVTRSEKMLGEKNIYRIQSPFSTFDFDAAITTGLGEIDFRNDKEIFLQWITNWLNQIQKEPQHAGVPRFVRPSIAKSDLPRPFIEELHRAAIVNPATHAQKIRVYECALLDKNGVFLQKYRTRFIMTCKIVRNLRILHFDFNIGRGEFESANLGCSVINEKGEPLPFVPYVHELGQALEDSQNLRSYRAFITFDRNILSEGSIIHLEVEYTAPDSYPGLQSGPEYSVFFRNQGPADEVNVAVAFPKERVRHGTFVSDLAALSPRDLDEIKYPMDEGEVIIASEPLDVSEFIDGLRLDCPADRYLLVGRRAKNVENLRSIGFLLDTNGRTA